MVKAGLELIGHQHHLVVIAVKGLAHIAAFEIGVHVVFGKFLVEKAIHIRIFSVEGHFTRECHHGVNLFVALFPLLSNNVLIKGQFITHHFLTGAGDHHGLGLPT